MSAVSEYTKWWDGDGTLAPSEVALGLRLAAAAIAELEAMNERANRDFYVAEEARYDAVKALQKAEAERDQANTSAIAQRWSFEKALEGRDEIIAELEGGRDVLRATVLELDTIIDAQRRLNHEHLMARKGVEAELEAINAIVAHVGTEAWEEAEYLAREEAERNAP